MIKLKGIKYPTIVYSAIIVIVCWSLLEGWIPAFRRKWLFLAVGLFLSIPYATSFFRSKRFWYLLLYVAILLLNFLSGDSYFYDFGSVGFEFFALAFPAVVSYYLFKEYSKANILVVLFSFFFVLVYTSLASFIIDLTLESNAIRLMTRYSITLGDMSTVYGFYRLGLSTYSFPHSMPILIPPLVMGIKNKHLNRWGKICCIILLISTLMLVWLSGIMTALLLSILFLILSSITQVGDVGRNIKKLSIIILLSLPLFSNTFLLDITQYSKSIVDENSFYYEKLEYFEEELQSPDENSDRGEDWDERQELYAKSLSGFIDNIIIGTNDHVGQHSTFLDRLGVLGIVGFIPFALFIYYQYSENKKHIKSNYFIFYIEGYIAGIMMLALKSSFSVYIWIIMFTILPLTTHILSLNENNK